MDCRAACAAEPNRSPHTFVYNDLSQKIDQLSVLARQCIAAVCFERYCKFHGLQGPDFEAFIEHLWRVATLANPEEFVEWEQGFQRLKVTGWGEPLSETFLEALPPKLRQEYPELVLAVIETSAMTWYGHDMEGTKRYLIRVIEMVAKDGIAIPNLELFKSSSSREGGGWGRNPSADELYRWRYRS